MLKGFLVAIGTFLAGAPVVWFTVPTANDGDATPVPGVVVSHEEHTHTALGIPNDEQVVFEYANDDFVCTSGMLIARMIKTKDEGVYHTIVFSTESGNAQVLKVFPGCTPVAWSPTQDHVLLLRETAADCDDRHFLWKAGNAAALTRNYLGCRYCQYDNWQAKADLVKFQCDGKLKEVCAATDLSATFAQGAN